MRSARPSFPGFPPEMITFFRGLDKHNRREWFQPRKDLFEQKVKAPMVDLVECVNRELVRWAPDYVNDPRKAIYRIYRDTRFSSDKTPYKTHIAAIFPRRGFPKHAAGGLYFSVSPKEVEVAGGVYLPQPEQLAGIRNHLAEHHAAFRRILASKPVRTLLGELWGEQLTRMPKGFSADHPAADLIRYKRWILYRTFDGQLATTPELFPRLIACLKALLPFVEFLNVPIVAERKKAAAFLV